MGPQERAGHDTHGQERLGPYLLGALSVAEEYEFEAHLLRCARCRTEADALSEVAVSIAALPATIIEQFEDADADDPTEPAATARIGRYRPADSRPGTGGSRPADSRPRTRGNRLSRILLINAAVLLLGVLLGAGGYFWLSPKPPNQVPVGSEIEDLAAGRLSVTVTARPDGGTNVRAMAVGLRPGVAFKLIAVGADDRVYRIARGLAAGGPQTLQGRVPIPASDVRFFAVLQADVLLIARAPGS